MAFKVAVARPLSLSIPARASLTRQFRPFVLSPFVVSATNISKRLVTTKADANSLETEQDSWRRLYNELPCSRKQDVWNSTFLGCKHATGSCQCYIRALKGENSTLEHKLLKAAKEKSRLKQTIVGHEDSIDKLTTEIEEVKAAKEVLKETVSLVQIEVEQAKTKMEHVEWHVNKLFDAICGPYAAEGLPNFANVSGLKELKNAVDALEAEREEVKQKLQELTAKAEKADAEKEEMKRELKHFLEQVEAVERAAQPLRHVTEASICEVVTENGVLQE